MLATGLEHAVNLWDPLTAEHLLSLWGPDTDAWAEPVEIRRADDGRSITVRYEAKQDIGNWESAYNGQWEVRLSPRAIRDTERNFIRWRSRSTTIRSAADWTRPG